MKRLREMAEKWHSLEIENKALKLNREQQNSKEERLIEDSLKLKSRIKHIEVKQLTALKNHEQIVQINNTDSSRLALTRKLLSAMKADSLLNILNYIDKMHMDMGENSVDISDLIKQKKKEIGNKDNLA